MYPVKEVETTSPNTSFHAAPRTCVRGWPPQIVHAGSQVKGGGHASAALSVGSRRVVNNRDVNGHHQRRGDPAHRRYDCRSVVPFGEIPPDMPSSATVPPGPTREVR